MVPLTPVRFRRALLVFYLLAVAGAFLACTGDISNGAAPATATTAAAGSAAGVVREDGDTPVSTASLDREQVLNLNLTAEPATLDPQRATDAVSQTVLRNIYSGLLRLDPEGQLVPDLAREVPTVQNGGISEDGLTYTFRLREGLMWSDGTPLVAQAFVDAAHHLFAPGSNNRYVAFYRIIASDGPHGDANLALLEALEQGVTDVAALEQAVVDGLQVEAPDDLTVVYHLNQNSPVFLSLATLWPMYPIRADIMEAAGDDWTEAGTLVSNGPFALSEWEHGEHLQLVRNEYWHGDDVWLEVINFDMIDDGALAFLAYQNDELDSTLLGPTELVQVREDEALREEFIGYAMPGTMGVYFNAEDPLFADVRVRQALAGAVDRAQFTSAVLEGNGAPAFSWLPPGMPGHDPDLGMQFDHNVAVSQALLAEAGAEGAQITILTSEATPAVMTAQWLKEQWERTLAITVTIDSRESSSFSEAFGRGEFQVIIGGWQADYPDPQNWLPNFRTGSSLNFGNFSNEEYDRLIDAAAAELDYEERLALYAQAQEILIDQVGVMPLYYRYRSALVKPWVQGLVPAPYEGQVPGDLFLDRVSISGRP